MPTQGVKMTSIERHKKLLEQSEEILDLALSKGLLANPRAIAFATSSGSIDLLSIYLHELGKLPIGKVVEHQWFKFPKEGQKVEPIYERKLGVDFPNKKQIIELVCRIEEKRTVLAYGNPSEKDITETVNTFKILKELIGVDKNG